MNEYESVIIINPNIGDDEIKATITKISDLINQNGKLTTVDEKGIRKLAYDIRKCKEGYYVIFYFQSEAGFIAELERIYRITDEIIKFMTVRKDD